MQNRNVTILIRTELQIFMRRASQFLLVLCLGIQTGLFSSNLAAEEKIVVTTDGMEITVDRVPARGEYLLLWIAPEYGFRPAHHSMAKNLAKNGVEIWQTDIVESLFLPPGSNSLKSLSGQYVADLVESANALTGKKIVVVGDSYAAMNALLGARMWQDRNHTESYLIGAILFSPYSYASIPPLGLAPDYLPIVDSTNIPLLIYQAQNSGVTGQFDQLLARLRANDSPIYTQLLPDIMSLFYEEEPTPAMIQAAQTVAHGIRQLLPVLAQHGVPANPVPFDKAVTISSGIDNKLEAFVGTVEPLPIFLTDINGKSISRSDYSGKITVINFWATWCPPCIQEIPSLNRLKKAMHGYPFELLSINYAEDPKVILEFMRQVEVDFPVLLDRNGTTAHRWNVITYPSTFVIDSRGQFRYGTNAAIEWDTPEVIEKLKRLTP